MTKEEFPNLSNYKGLTLITTDGTTLLGADDKAGVSVNCHCRCILISSS